MTSHSQIALLQQRTQCPRPLLVRTAVVVGSQQAVAVGTRSQAVVTLQVLPSQSAKAVEEVGYFLAFLPGFRLGTS